MENINIEKIETLAKNRQFEIVERKGKGHPDTLIDGIVEEISKNLSKEYIKRTGKILHHNVDKGVIIGGSSKVRFGYGEITKPIYIIIAGRATQEIGNEEIPIFSIALNSTEKYLRENTRFLDVENEVITDPRLLPGSQDLVSIFSTNIPLANDTSVGTGFYPLTETEKLVLETERYLNSKKYKEKMPMCGEDIKVLAVRKKESINLTVAIAFIAPLIKDIREYITIKREIKKDIKEFASTITEKKVNVFLNVGDDENKGIVYITKSGLSCESGDDGEVGRGNRANGLITPFRVMNMEATAGKNPRTHVGKIYNVLANEIAKNIVEEIGVEEANVFIASQIGKRIDKPQSVIISLPKEEISKSEKAKRIAEEWLERIEDISKGILEGKYNLF
ncbi:MAG: methionine adenosyltransferase [Candidatus Micrarchaeia archaeon]